MITKINPAKIQITIIITINEKRKDKHHVKHQTSSLFSEVVSDLEFDERSLAIQ